MNHPRLSVSFALMALLPGLYGCSSGLVKTDFSATAGDLFTPRTVNATITRYSAAQLVRLGYVKVGDLSMSARSGDMTTRLLAEAAQRGADLVILKTSNDNRPAKAGSGACVRYEKKTIRQEECIAEPDCTVCAKMCKSTLKEEDVCTERAHASADAGPVVVSEGELWRHEPELAQKAGAARSERDKK